MSFVKNLAHPILNIKELKKMENQKEKPKKNKKNVLKIAKNKSKKKIWCRNVLVQLIIQG